MTVDYPRAWAISRSVVPEKHHEKCSTRQTNGAILCDCDVLFKHPDYLSNDFICEPLPICRCGGVNHEHRTGDDGCYRELVRVHPRKVSCEEDRWMVDGHNITGTTLRQQRGYHQHANGRWTRIRPRFLGDTNSIKG